MLNPTTHQQLFAAFVSTRYSLIYWGSVGINRDCEELRQWARDYAQSSGLELPYDCHEPFGAYEENF